MPAHGLDRRSGRDRSHACARGNASQAAPAARDVTLERRPEVPQSWRASKAANNVAGIGSTASTRAPAIAPLVEPGDNWGPARTLVRRSGSARTLSCPSTAGQRRSCAMGDLTPRPLLSANDRRWQTAYRSGVLHLRTPRTAG